MGPRLSRYMKLPFLNQVSPWSIQQAPREVREFRVFGAEVLMLRLMRAAGIAPVSIKRRSHGECIVTLSRGIEMYCYAINAVIALIVTAGVVGQFFKDEPASLVFHSKLSAILWIFKIIFTFVVIGTAIRRCAHRTTRLLYYQDQFRNIKGTIENYQTSSMINGRLRIHAMLIVIGAIISMILTIFRFMTKEVKGSLFYNTYILSFFCVYNITTNLLELQLIHVVQLLQRTLHIINNSLETLQHNLQSDERNFPDTQPLKDISNITKLYLSALQLMEQIIKSEGVMLLLIFGIVAFEINLSVYFMYFNFSDKGTLHKIFAVIDKLWVHFYKWICLILLIEPCHATHKELETTCMLVSELLSNTYSAQSPLAMALQELVAALQPAPPVIAPVGIFPFSRSLYSTVIGSITTFFTLVLRFDTD